MLENLGFCLMYDVNAANTSTPSPTPQRRRYHRRLHVDASTPSTTVTPAHPRRHRLLHTVLPVRRCLHAVLPTGNTVSIKRIRLGKHNGGVNFTALREIKLLKELKDLNIIELIDCFPYKGDLHHVFVFMEIDLEAVIRDSNIVLSPADIKPYVQMMLKGLAFCHKKWVLHRDMKLNNLLISADGQLKLADFDLARIFGSPGRNFTHQEMLAESMPRGKHGGCIQDRVDQPYLEKKHPGCACAAVHRSDLAGRCNGTKNWDQVSHLA